MSMSMSKKNRIHIPKGDRAFYFAINLIIAILCLLVLYPLVYIVSSSFSSSKAVLAGKVVLLPVDLSVEGYRAVFSNRNIGIGYRNTILYTVGGTMLNLVMTFVCAYPLAARDLPHKGKIMFLFTLTMFFSGGMIPNYILMRQLGLLDNVLAVVLPGAIGVSNMILARTFIQNIPYDMYEAAEIDGCSDARYFVQMVLPLSKACIAVLALYYAVGHWNAYFNAFIYLNDRNMYPLSLFLREILISNQMTEAMDIDPELLEKKQGLSDVLKYSLIVVSTVPILCVYPFIQKYFIKGVMIGSLKG